MFQTILKQCRSQGAADLLINQGVSELGREKGGVA
jgi:hypothetical protein